ncbi:hypothetical protein TrCOL_g10889 [Triparma columacea]|uniref:VOC domain-containing protein n=1 Tax=Triparma columacea TaxID=722753 RepID=A0A9W7GAZ9_9STRA|nr:hypothetical protein TrCOL_g10889 [Triparma columacea]
MHVPTNHLLAGPVFYLLICQDFLSVSSFSSIPGSYLTIKSFRHGTDNHGTTLLAHDIILLDHLNINHEKGTHNALCDFYFNTLGFRPDPRKSENLEKGGGTVWANAGATQVHLSEGKPQPQVLDGFVTLKYPSSSSLKDLTSRAKENGVEVRYSEADPTHVTLFCPYGNKFVAEVGPRDPRGYQDEADEALCNGISELTLHTKSSADLPGIARFYEVVFGLTPDLTSDKVSVPFGPHQRLTFVPGPVLNSNYEDGLGPHISLYLHGLSNAWERASAHGLVYVNPRFKRKASTYEEAITQCMFRVLHIVDPDTDRKIMRLEHEIRSKYKNDGLTLYKSFPFDS